MRITVVGSGYVGLVTAACFTEMGNNVYCVDVDTAKLEQLKQGHIPIYEPGLKDVVARGREAGLLTFTDNLSEALEDSDYVFNCVGTPSDEDGSADLKYVLQVATQIGEVMSHYLVVINKSTVPVGTADKVRAHVQAALDKRGSDLDFDVVSNPEFLKEGAAVSDFMRPDRIVIGVDSDKARKLMSALYAPYLWKNDRLMVMGIRDAEMTKYAANAMLATKISFMNEIANICDRVGADVENVRQGIGSDSRIGFSFIYPGCGYGGSCFPKDVSALIHTGEVAEFEPQVLRAVHQRNQLQKHVLFDKVSRYFDGALQGKRFGVWGLAFKPGTDDMRYAPSIDFIKAAINAGATVAAHDPEALVTARAEFPAEWLADGRLTLSADQYGVLEEADAMVLVTEWKRFRQPDFVRMSKLLRQSVIFDGRNQYDPEYLKMTGFDYIGMGRNNLDKRCQ